MQETDYFNLPGFENLYLEDSFVLDISDKPELFSFKMDFVLTESHPQYIKPPKDSAFCYRNGYINFINPIRRDWEHKNFNCIPIDASGAYDLGNINNFYKIGEDYLLEGDRGEIKINCKALNVILDK